MNVEESDLPRLDWQPASQPAGSRPISVQNKGVFPRQRNTTFALIIAGLAPYIVQFV